MMITARCTSYSWVECFKKVISVLPFTKVKSPYIPGPLCTSRNFIMTGEINFISV